MENSAVNYRLSFYDVFLHSLVWVEVIFVVLTPILTYLINLAYGVNTGWVYIILYTIFAMIVGMIYCLAFTAISVKIYSVEISSSGIKGTGFFLVKIMLNGSRFLEQKDGFLFC